jgi:hypothetical protein
MARADLDERFSPDTVANTADGSANGHHGRNNPPYPMSGFAITSDVFAHGVLRTSWALQDDESHTYGKSPSGKPLWISNPGPAAAFWAGALIARTALVRFALECLPSRNESCTSLASWGSGHYGFASEAIRFATHTRTHRGLRMSPEITERLRARVADLKQQLAFFEGNNVMSFWRRDGYGPRIEMKSDTIEHLKRCIVDAESRLAHAEKGW